jgi:sulfur-oxidizing protein SoxB
LQRREFLRLLALAAAVGASLRPRLSDAQAAAELYDLPAFGNVSLLHITDVHAQLLPVHFREPSVNIGVGSLAGMSPHLVGEALLKRFEIASDTPRAHAFTFLDFESAARRYGKTGGYAHLATLVKRLRSSRPHALLLDGGDSWQGSATALWTEGRDMIGAQKRLGVDYMTAHWEFTYGAERVQQAIRELAPIEFLAQNVRTVDFEDVVFKPYALRTVNGVPIAIIGQAFPYTPIAHPRHRFPEWSFGIRERELQARIDDVRAQGARAVVLLSHQWKDLDL